MELRIWHTGPVLLPGFVLEEKDTSVHACIKLNSYESEKTKRVETFSSINEDEFVLSMDLTSPEKKEEFKKKLIEFITEKIDNLV